MWRCHEGTESSSTDVMGLPQVIQVSVYSQWEHLRYPGTHKNLGTLSLVFPNKSLCVNQAATLDIQDQIWDVQIWSGGW